MEVTEIVNFSSDERIFNVKVSGAEIRELTQTTMIARMGNMINMIEQALVKEFLDVHRVQVMSNINLLDVIQRVKEKAGDEMVRGLIK